MGSETTIHYITTKSNKPWFFLISHCQHYNCSNARHQQESSNNIIHQQQNTNNNTHQHQGTKHNTHQQQSTNTTTHQATCIITFQGN